jgi:hypothetical protein
MANHDSEGHRQTPSATLLQEPLSGSSEKIRENTSGASVDKTREYSNTSGETVDVVSAGALLDDEPPSKRAKFTEFNEGKSPVAEVVVSDESSGSVPESIGSVPEVQKPLSEAARTRLLRAWCEKHGVKLAPYLEIAGDDEDGTEVEKGGVKENEIASDADPEASDLYVSRGMHIRVKATLDAFMQVAQAGGDGNGDAGGDRNADAGGDTSGPDDSAADVNDSSSGEIISDESKSAEAAVPSVDNAIFALATVPSHAVLSDADIPAGMWDMASDDIRGEEDCVGDSAEKTTGDLAGSNAVPASSGETPSSEESNSGKISVSELKLKHNWTAMQDLWIFVCLVRFRHEIIANVKSNGAKSNEERSNDSKPNNVKSHDIKSHNNHNLQLHSAYVDSVTSLQAAAAEKWDGYIRSLPGEFLDPTHWSEDQITDLLAGTNLVLEVQRVSNY